MSGQGAISTPNLVRCHVVTESGCDPSKGEYTLYIVQFLGQLNVSQLGGVDDVSLIQECVVDGIDWSRVPEEGITELLLEEAFEREDVFVNKYYAILSQVVAFDAGLADIQLAALGI